MGLVVTFTKILQRMTSSAELKFLVLGFLLPVFLSLEGEDFLFFWTLFFSGAGAILDVDGCGFRNVKCCCHEIFNFSDKVLMGTQKVCVEKPTRPTYPIFRMNWDENLSNKLIHQRTVNA
jgi:hypothetical protein